MQESKLVPIATAFGSSKANPDWILGFSALRDPKRQEVRLFFDSFEELARQIDKVLFLQEMTDSITEGAYEVSGCILELISDPVGKSLQKDILYHEEGDALKVLEGWQLTCQDPNQDSKRALLIYNGTRYASFKIETISTKQQGKIAACVGPLYTKRRLTKPWVFFSTWLGIERFNIYHAIVGKVTLPNPWMSGIWPSSELNQHSQVDLFPHSSIRWYSYEAPPFRYYHGQTTALNDCLVRNRYLYEYLVISDVDEVIRTMEEPKSDLGALLDQHFPINTSNMVIPRYNFPIKCCKDHLDTETLDDEASSVQFFESCKLHVMKDHDFGKSIVRPELVEAVSQHISILHRPGFDSRVILDPHVAHLVHVNSNAGWTIPMECEAAHEGFVFD
jgi:hypothetical protein